MRQLASVFVLLLLAASVAHGGAVLYATAAREARIDAFCLDREGKLQGSPGQKQFPTSSANPRRILVAEDVITEVNPERPNARLPRDVLYAALERRVQAFDISPGGWLDGVGSTAEVEGLDPRDLAVSPTKRRLYIAQHGTNRIAAHEIDPATGAPSEEPKSCAFGRGGAQYVGLAIGPMGQNPSSPTGAFLYASSESSGRVDIYPVDGNGDILEVETNADGAPVLDPATQDDDVPEGVVTCPEKGPCSRPKVTPTVSLCKCPEPQPPDPPSTDELYPYTPASLAERCAAASKKKDDRPPVTQPLSRRDGLGQPKALILDGEMLYVEERYRKRIVVFRLNDGLFCDADAQCPGFDPGPDTNRIRKCRSKQQKRIDNGKTPRQCAADRTPELGQYESLVLFDKTLIGTQFFQNRVDAYRLNRPNNNNPPLPNNHGSSKVDVSMSPVRATAINLFAIRGECSDTDPLRPCSCPPNKKATCGAVYVAAGSLNRVNAYAISTNGKLSHLPFSMTDEQKGSFPSDVAVAVLPESCSE
jgi:hypothetical protein